MDNFQTFKNFLVMYKPSSNINVQEIIEKRKLMMNLSAHIKHQQQALLNLSLCTKTGYVQRALKKQSNSQV
jgi:hypothetical protein